MPLHSGPVRSRRRAARPAADTGFTLIEVLVSIMLIGVVMTALATFFITTVSAVSRQSGRQIAVQLADDGAERVRALKGSAVAVGRDKISTDSQWSSPVVGAAQYLADMQKWWDAAAVFPAGATAALQTTARPVTVNGIVYGQNWYVGKCWQPSAGGACGATPTTGYVEFFRVVMAVTWAEKHCANSVCSYLTSTLVSSASGEPVFNPGLSAAPPTVNNPGHQVGEVSVPAVLQLTAAGGAPPVTWAGSGLPTGMSMSSGGLISGAPTVAGSYSVTVSATDGFALIGTAAFTWTVNPLPVLTNPGSLTTASGTLVTRPIVHAGGTGPLVWSVTAPGNWGLTGLPPGLVIDPLTGVITGLPITVGPAKDVTVTVTDLFGKTASTTFSWAVTGALTLVGPTSAARSDPIGTAISVQATASGGTGPYTWTAANLPAGLVISPAGLISGVLGTGTRFLATVTVKDATGASKSVTLPWTVVASGSNLRFNSPNGDRIGDLVGQNVAINPNAPGGSAAGLVWTATGLPPGMTQAVDGKITGQLSKAGSYTVTLTVRDSANNVATFMFVWTVL